MRKFSVLQRSRKALGAALISGLLGVCGINPAQAAYFTGAWDPAFGVAFPDLGWRGEAEFFVPDACLANSGWVFNFNSCSNWGMKILSAEVEFYKLSDPTNTVFHETLEFDVPDSFVLKMQLDDGLLTGLFGTFLYSRDSTIPLAGGPYTEFVLFFEDDFARLGFVSHPQNCNERRGYGHGEDCKPEYGVSEKYPREGGSPLITFRLVPEPAGLPLLLIGLGALGFWARRRKVA